MLHGLFGGTLDSYMSARGFSVLYTLCIYSITLWQSLQWWPAQLQRGGNKQAAVGQLIHPNQIHFSIWFGASVICQSICDSEGTSRPRGISCKSNESISSPATPQTLARKKSETSSPYVELMIFFFFKCTGKMYCLLDTLYMQKYHPAGLVFQKLYSLLCCTHRGYCRIYQRSCICVQFLVISFTPSPPFSLHFFLHLDSHI